MMWLARLVAGPYIKKLEKEIADLQDKLVKRQEDLNRTNSYWKKKIANLHRNQSSKNL